ncbi:hypothetical protein J5N97_029883 [Dioscorea zingiberensis]|uniref:WRKY domain-containing protein n=1 Tax=Dioscorea zingiberensis TaxID=325984 RepID=A0A9D5H3I9_9LILI|nr:hypothetical protein J5N97_029883 [Dioscorea zingiberensis]
MMMNQAAVIPNWELMSFHEAARNSLSSAHHLFQLISRQKINTSSNELSLIAHTAISEFKTLVSILEGSCSSTSRLKRIRKGPLPNLQQMDLHELMDPGIQFFPRPETLVSHRNAVVQPLNTCFDPRVVVPMSKQLLNYYYCYSSMSAQQGSIGEASMLSSKRRKHGNEAGGLKCTVSTGGCHCSKRRKQRIRRTIRVSAMGGKFADLPTDDFSWRKYGQKPIKGSPHPRNPLNDLAIYPILICIITSQEHP